MSDKQILTLPDVILAGLKAMDEHRLQAQLVKPGTANGCFNIVGPRQENKGCVIGVALSAETREIVSRSSSLVSTGLPGLINQGIIEVPDEDLRMMGVLQAFHDAWTRDLRPKDGVGVYDLAHLEPDEKALVDPLMSDHVNETIFRSLLLGVARVRGIQIDAS